MKMKMKYLAVATLAMLAVASAQAETYVGAGFGQGKINLDCDGTLSCDNSVTTGKVFGGYKFSDSYGVELTAVNFGKVKATALISGTRVGASVDHTTFAVSLFSVYNFSNKWALVSRLGVASNKADAEVNASGQSATLSKRSVAPYAAIGVAYNFSDSLAVEIGIDSTIFKDPSDDRYGAYLGGIALRATF